jgi:hypothetical protein
MKSGVYPEKSKSAASYVALLIIEFAARAYVSLLHA